MSHYIDFFLQMFFVILFHPGTMKDNVGFQDRLEATVDVIIRRDHRPRDATATKTGIDRRDHQRYNETATKTGIDHRDHRHRDATAKKVYTGRRVLRHRDETATKTDIGPHNRQRHKKVATKINWRLARRHAVTVRRLRGRQLTRTL